MSFHYCQVKSCYNVIYSICHIHENSDKEDLTSLQFSEVPGTFPIQFKLDKFKLIPKVEQEKSGGPEVEEGNVTVTVVDVEEEEPQKKSPLFCILCEKVKHSGSDKWCVYHCTSPDHGHCTAPMCPFSVSYKTSFCSKHSKCGEERCSNRAHIGSTFCTYHCTDETHSHCKQNACTRSAHHDGVCQRHCKIQFHGHCTALCMKQALPGKKRCSEHSYIKRISER